MTIEARREFFGLITLRRALYPGTTIWREEEKKAKPRTTNVLNVVVVDKDTIRFTRFLDVYGKSPKTSTKTQKGRLARDQINQNNIRFPLFPGATEGIVWEPSR